MLFFENNIVWALIYTYLIDRFLVYNYNKHINKHMFFIELFIEAYSIYSKDHKFFILFTILLTISITDYINQDVYSIFNYLLAITMYILVRPNITRLLLSMMVPISLYIINRFLNGIGSGDIELLFALAFCFEIVDMVKIIFVSSFLNLVYAFFKKKSSYSFVPFLSISCLIIYLFN